MGDFEKDFSKYVGKKKAKKCIKIYYKNILLIKNYMNIYIFVISQGEISVNPPQSAAIQPKVMICWSLKLNRFYRSYGQKY